MDLLIERNRLGPKGGWTRGGQVLFWAGAKACRFCEPERRVAPKGPRQHAVSAVSKHFMCIPFIANSSSDGERLSCLES